MYTVPQYGHVCFGRLSDNCKNIRGCLSHCESGGHDAGKRFAGTDTVDIIPLLRATIRIPDASQ